MSYLRRRLDDASTTNEVEGPIFHLVLLHYVFTIELITFLFILYLILPRGFRFRYCGAYPRQYARSGRYHTSKITRGGSNGGGLGVTRKMSGSSDSSSLAAERRRMRAVEEEEIILDDHLRQQQQQQRNVQYRSRNGSFNKEYDGIGSNADSAFEEVVLSDHQQRIQQQQSQTNPNNENDNNNNNNKSNYQPIPDPENTHPTTSTQQPESTSPPTPALSDAVISATMQRLRDPGTHLIAHGTKSKPKTVILQLHPKTITWHTDNNNTNNSTTTTQNNKKGKTHEVPLDEILYVDVGKHTQALLKVEMASVSETLCFSLLTRQGSLDLQCQSCLERDALVSCFSLVLDEVHASGMDWRMSFKEGGGPGSDLVSDMPSSIDTEMFYTEEEGRR